MAAKKIGRSDIIGERGIAHIRRVTLDMGFMFYETGGVEAGIDGFIELRDEATGEVGYLILQVQGKATRRGRGLSRPPELQRVSAQSVRCWHHVRAKAHTGIVSGVNGTST